MSEINKQRMRLFSTHKKWIFKFFPFSPKKSWPKIVRRVRNTNKKTERSPTRATAGHPAEKNLP